MLKQESNYKSISALQKIFRSRGLRGVWLHLLNIWFDIIRGIDTVERHKAENIEKSYVTTAQYSIRKSLKIAINFLYKNNKFKKFNFIELGAGKGKVIIILKELIFKRYKKFVDILAIEIDQTLCKLLIQNLLKSGFSIDKNKKNFLGITNNKKINIELFKNDMNSLKSKNKLNEFCNKGHNIFYCCDSLDKENILNLIKQIILNKNPLVKNIDILIYSNPRYLYEILSKFKSEVKIIKNKIGFPQESFAILEIKNISEK